MKEGRSVGPLEFFEETHKKKYGGLNDRAANIVEIVQNKVDEKKGDSEVSGQELFKLQQEAFSEVFGPEHPGHVRGYGFGVTPTQVHGFRRSSATATSEVEELKRLIEEMKQDKVENDQKFKKLEEEFAFLKNMVLSWQPSNTASTSR